MNEVKIMNDILKQVIIEYRVQHGEAEAIKFFADVGHGLEDKYPQIHTLFQKLITLA